MDARCRVEPRRGKLTEHAGPPLGPAYQVRQFLQAIHDLDQADGLP